MADRVFTMPAVPLVMPRPVVDPVPDKLPPILRLLSIERHRAPTGQVLNRATVYHQSASLAVEWLSRHQDVRLTNGSLVIIRWLGNPTAINGHVRISRLVLTERPEPEINLFDLVPPNWVRDREVLDRATTLWESLPRGFKHLFNAMFWDGRRFQRYLMGPSSLENHHNQINGNFRHSVEVAEQAPSLTTQRDLVYTPIVVLGGLIHDAGKADDYRYDRLRQTFEMSAHGSLVCHRDRLQHWIAAAMAQYRVIIPEMHFLGLIHALTAAKGAPAHLGLREPRSLEATVLTMADRLSGEGEMFKRLAPAEGGFGRFHKHMKGRPFVVASKEGGVYLGQ